jgi:hypothetical protein
MQPVAVSPGAMLAVLNRATPESLSAIATSPAANEFPGLLVGAEKAALLTR